MKNMLSVNEVNSENNKIVIFSTGLDIWWMRRFSDDVFEYCSQTFTIHTMKNNNYSPLTFCLLR